MAEVTNELIYEVLKTLQQGQAQHQSAILEVKAEINALRGHMLAMQQDIANIYTKLYSLDDRVSRIEKRLDLVVEPG